MRGSSPIPKLQTSAVQTWDGSWITLNPNDSATIPQTPNGTVILVAANTATQNNLGELTLTSGGSPLTTVRVPALSGQPVVVTRNWKANNLTVTNTSLASSTPIMVALCGPGMQGSSPVDLPIGTPVLLGTVQSAQGTASPQNMQLVTTSNSATLGVVGIIGGPLDATGNNGYVIAVNASSNTGPPPGTPPPEGYFATTTTNGYAFPFNWGSSAVYAVNLSPQTAQVLSVLLRAF